MENRPWEMPSLARTPRAMWNSRRGSVVRLPARHLSDEELQERLHLRTLGLLRLCYAPLEYERRNAPIAVVGLTPGMHTFRASVMVAGELLRAGLSDDAVLRRTKETAPFSDPGTRARLIGWLEDLGVARQFGLRSCSELYAPSGQHLVHWTSLIRYPAFRWSASKDRWVNYSGQPDPLRHFGDVIRGAFVPEARRLRAHVIFTCGDKVAATCRRLAAEGLIDSDRMVALPHPSGGNVGNDDEYAKRRPELRRAVKRIYS